MDWTVDSQPKGPTRNNAFMGLANVLNSPGAVALALLLARLLPPRLGHWVGDQVGGLVAGRRASLMVRAVRANQWVAAGGNLSSAELDRRTQATFRSTGRSLYDFYHYNQDSSALERLVEISPSFQRCIERSRSGQAQFLLIPHFSNFDLVGRAAVQAGLRMQVLSYAQPPAGYRLQNALRTVPGFDITPISVEMLRKALDRLRGGGTVLTAVDRPTPGADLPMAERPLFFQRPADLPTGYIRLAMSAGAPLVVVSGQTLADGRYGLWASEPLQIPRGSPRAGEVKCLAEAVLEIVSQIIRQSPEHWSMFYPVWPEALNEIPA